MIEVQMIGMTELRARLSGASTSVWAKITTAMDGIVDAVADAARLRMSELFNNPGKMQASVATKVEPAGGTVTGTVGAYGLPYLRAQEFGGTWTIPEIFPVNAKVLAFPAPGGGGMIFTRHTKAHPVTLPERSYMRSALALEQSNIVARLQAAAEEGIHANA